MILNRLRPTRTWRVLRADVAGHRQYERTITIRKIANDADIAAITESTGAPERTSKRVIDRQTEREEGRAGPIVSAHAVVPVVDEGPENDLRDVVAARRELVENDVFAGDGRAIPVRRLLDVVQGTRDERVVGDTSPIESRARARRRGVILARLRLPARSRTSWNWKRSHVL